VETSQAPSPATAPLATSWKFGEALGAALVVTCGFFAASYPAHNADVWQHLATGKALVEGGYRFGVDPFAYTTENAYWVNHNWLFDALLYGLHQALGGAALVGAKALLIGILTAILARLTWRGPQRWLALMLLVVALAAMSPYLLLRPICISLLFLGITYAWLERHPAAATWRGCVPLLMLFALWASMDEWFLLGPALVALWWCGAMVTRRPSTAGPTATEPSRRIPLVLVAGAGLLAVALNPHHIHVFSAPSLLDGSVPQDFLDDAADREALQSPVNWIRAADSLQQPARLAYGGLILAGLASFVVQGGHVSAARLLVWLVFLGLSVFRSGAIPFFAVVAAPIAALNLQEWLARRAATNTPLIRSRFVIGLLRLTSLLLLAGAATAAWTGWIRGMPGEPRRWDLALDPSLDAAARQVAAWRNDGTIPAEARALPTSSAAAYALAWLCPGEKSFCDARPHLFRADVQADFLTLRKALFQSDADPQEIAAGRDLLRKHRITHLIVDHADDAALATGLRKLFASRSRTLHYLHGRTTIFATHDGSANLTAAVVDPEQRAWQPAPADRAATPESRGEPEPRTWLDAFAKPPPKIDPATDEALLWRVHFDAQRLGYQERVKMQWNHGLAASLIGMPASEAGPAGFMPGSLTRFACLSYSQNLSQSDRSAPLHGLAVQVFLRFVALRDDAPPASLFLAIRSARRALAVNPDDARAHLLLGEAYLRLRQNTAERALGPKFAGLDQTRRVQALTALRTAARLDPRLLHAHELLVFQYSESHDSEPPALDLALAHVHAVLQLLPAHGSSPGATVEQHRQRLEFWEEQEKQLARAVRDAQIAAGARQLDLLPQAVAAQKSGLPGKALELLQKADATTKGQDGFLFELDLLLKTGHAWEMRDALPAELESALGAKSYRLLHAYLSAARGDYADADNDLSRLDGAVEFPELARPRVDPRVALGFLVGKHLLDRAIQPAPLGELPPELLARRCDFLVGQMRFQADIAALRGLLALEAGNIEAAREQFRNSTKLFDDPNAASGLARHYLEMMEKARAGR
jgi:hypothetical protein